LSLPFWRTRDRYYRILGNKCKACAQEYFPPVLVCRKCRSTDLVDSKMPDHGVVLSYTLQKESVYGFEDQEPMIFALVKLENGVKVIGQIVDAPYESLKEGTKVGAVFRKIRTDGESGQIFYGYKFSPRKESTASTPVA
jgi:uncharacterized OB-fold protein